MRSVNLRCFFRFTGCFIKIREYSLSYYLPIYGGRRDRFMPFPKGISRSGTQTNFVNLETIYLATVSLSIINQRSPNSVVAKVLNSDIIVNKFELQSCYYTNTLGKYADCISCRSPPQKGCFGYYTKLYLVIRLKFWNCGGCTIHHYYSRGSFCCVKGNVLDCNIGVK